MEITSKEFWMYVAESFKSDPSTFKNQLTVESYSDAVAGITPEEIKQALKSIHQKNPTKMPTPDEIRAAWKGYPVDSRERGLQSANYIWKMLGAMGGYASGEDVKRAFNDVEFDFVQNQGGWWVMCEDITNDMKPSFIAQARDYMASLYASEVHREKKRAVEQLKAAKENPALKAAVNVIEGGDHE